MITGNIEVLFPFFLPRKVYIKQDLAKSYTSELLLLKHAEMSLNVNLALLYDPWGKRYTVSRTALPLNERRKASPCYLENCPV